MPLSVFVFSTLFQSELYKVTNYALHNKSPPAVYAGMTGIGTCFLSGLNEHLAFDFNQIGRYLTEKVEIRHIIP
jgi:hypothetical protein